MDKKYLLILERGCKKNTCSVYGRKDGQPNHPNQKDHKVMSEKYLKIGKIEEGVKMQEKPSISTQHQSHHNKLS